jgi:hypothetical protein
VTISKPALMWRIARSRASGSDRASYRREGRRTESKVGNTANRLSLPQLALPASDFATSGAAGAPQPLKHDFTASMGTIDRSLIGLGVAIAVGSAAFAGNMIFQAIYGQKGAFDIASRHVASDLVVSSRGVVDDSTGSITKADRGTDVVPTPRVPRHRADQDDPLDPQPHSVSNYVLRYADRDAALVQGPGGILVVTPGSVIPDAGLIRSIEYRGGRWVVVTSNGTIEQPSFGARSESR